MMTDVDTHAAEAHSDHGTEATLRELIEIVANAKSMLMSSSAIINREEVLELLDRALNHLPEELRDARWMLKEREEFLARVQREADEIMDAAKVRASRLVEKQEIVREAQHQAQRTIDAARDESARLHHEAEDYCDQKLASFEIVLERLLKTSRAGRDKLAGQLASGLPSMSDRPSILLNRDAAADAAADEFFDQDITAI